MFCYDVIKLCDIQHVKSLGKKNKIKNLNNNSSNVFFKIQMHSL